MTDNKKEVGDQLFGAGEKCHACTPFSHSLFTTNLGEFRQSSPPLAIGGSQKACESNKIQSRCGRHYTNLQLLTVLFLHGVLLEILAKECGKTLQRVRSPIVRRVLHNSIQQFFTPHAGLSIGACTSDVHGAGQRQYQCPIQFFGFGGHQCFGFAQKSRKLRLYFVTTQTSDQS